MPTLAPVVSKDDAPLAAAWQALEDRFARLSAIEESLAVLRWDQSTMMPDGGAEARATQLSVLSGLHHAMLTAVETQDLIAAARVVADREGTPDPADPQAAWRHANLREIERLMRHALAVPQDLVEALTRAAASCEGQWRRARAEGAFSVVRPRLETLLGLVREVAAAKAEALGLAPYDALLDEYEPGATLAAITPVFDDLEAFLPGFLDQVLAHQGPAPAKPQGPFPQAIQERLARETMVLLGFDFAQGRLDVSAHPFCGGTATDLRLTTRYDPADFTTALLGVIHETGHALYEQGLPRRWGAQPVGRARSMSLHESQSLLMEMQVCRSRRMLAQLVPSWRAAFDGQGPAWEVDSMARAITRVAPGYIRVDADEVTYPAHVILRTRLESAMIAGDLAVVDLPGAWAEGLRDLLGLTPPDDRLGCLQDIHWYDGAFGYFPTYTLGAMTAAQLFQAACAQNPAIPEALNRADVTPLLAWLRGRVHGRASLLPTEALLVEATGRPLEAAPFKDHLRRRYLEGEG